MNPDPNSKTNETELAEALRGHLDRARELLDEYITSADGAAPNLQLADEYDASALEPGGSASTRDAWIFTAYAAPSSAARPFRGVRSDDGYGVGSRCGLSTTAG